MHHITAAALGSQFPPTQKKGQNKMHVPLTQQEMDFLGGWMGGGIHNVEGRLGEVESCTTLEGISSKGF